MPTKIRYYQCYNNGIGIIIWPQLRSDGNTNNIPWDGRGQSSSTISSYKLYINQNIRVDLMATGISPGTTFYLSEDTMFGTDMWDASTVFEYDPSSNQCASGVKRGGADDGGLTFTGLITVGSVNEAAVEAPSAIGSVVENDTASRYAAALLAETIESSGKDLDISSYPTAPAYQGRVAWEPMTPFWVIAQGFAAISTVLQHKFWVKATAPRMIGGVYQATFDFGYKYGPVADLVPVDIKVAWDLAVKAAGPSVGNLGVQELFTAQKK